MVFLKSAGPRLCRERSATSGSKAERCVRSVQRPISTPDTHSLCRMVDMKTTILAGSGHEMISCVHAHDLSGHAHGFWRGKETDEFGNVLAGWCKFQRHSRFYPLAYLIGGRRAKSLFKPRRIHVARTNCIDPNAWRERAG